MTRDQIFWSVFGLALVALAVVYATWSRGVYRQVEEQHQRWEAQRDELTVLRSLAGNRNLPNQESIDQWVDYKDWLKEQSDQALAFFRRRDEPLERSLIEGIRTPSPGDFKSAYNDLYRDSNLVVRRHIERGVDIRQAADLFTRYPWMDTEATPSPEDYRAIQKDLWIRRYFVLDLLLAHNVNAISVFSVMPSEVIPIPNTEESEFRAIPVRVRCALPAEQVVKLLTAMLRVSESDPDKLQVVMRELDLSKGPGAGRGTTPPVTLEFLVDVVDFNPRTD